MPYVRFCIIVISTVLLLLVDQLSKFWVITNLNQPLVIIPDFFALTYVRNYGLAFGLANFQLSSTLLLFIIPLIIVIGYYLAFKHLKLEHPLTMVIISLIASGGLANWVDRLRFGQVIDFISIYRYPVFNLADSFVTIGVILLIVYFSKIQRPHR